jgi:acetyl coenzyme A synthetase (ADP forming)-like protein
MERLSATLPSSDETTMRAVLRDGSVAVLKVADPSDHDAVQRFFHELSPESRRRRFFTLAEPADELVGRLCDSSNPRRAMTLLAIRTVDGVTKPIAMGSYFATGGGSAEAAFAVDDQFHGKGIGTILLERLAAIAVAQGFDRFEAMTLPENAAMLEVFHESGFEIRSKTEQGTIAVQLSLRPTDGTVAAAERRMALATAASLRPVFEPASVAVIGASRTPSSIGHRIVKALADARFKGTIYPINPAASEIEGLRCYPSLAAAPRGIDLAVIAVPRTLVLPVVDECANAGVKSIVVITAGFAETGDEGRALQNELLEKVRGHGMRMVGPNCMGVLNANPAVSMNASFSPLMPASGHVAFSSQSGALGIAILGLAGQRGVGLSTFVSVGNKADVSSNDLLQYWEADPNTSLILLYLESFGNPRRFARLARRIGRVKPIICVKAGRTRAGSRAAGSHTAALMASETAVDALFHQTGVIRAATIDEMFDIAACLDAQPLPPGRRVAIVTNAGGPGILAVDACESAGLEVVPFSEATRQRLAAFLPQEASMTNPVDMVASAGPGEFRQAIEVAATSSDVDALIVIYTPVDRATSVATIEAIRDGVVNARTRGATGKPVLACIMGESGGSMQLMAGSEHVPTYLFPENAARALARAASYAEWRNQVPGLLWGFDDVRVDEAREICRAAIASRGDTWLTADETRELLGAFNFPLAASLVARSAADAAAVAHTIGFPVAAKLATRGLSHKTEIGGVRLNLGTDAAVERAFDDLMTAGRALGSEGAVDGVLIQAMVSNGVETMMGVSEDPLFGPLIAFGLGGIHVEILHDVQFRIAPLTDRDADELLHGIHGLPLLKGYRGHAPADCDALRDLLLRISRLVVDVSEIAELDLNPVIALAPGQGCRVVDARVRVRSTRRQPS